MVIVVVYMGVFSATYQSLGESVSWIGEGVCYGYFEMKTET